ncbi:hypothetical protein LTR50_001353 [Elasticomyces elasticus]|nr:hypothetical protein LTR50_001353 [Elasticomyces elasticus]
MSVQHQCILINTELLLWYQDSLQHHLDNLYYPEDCETLQFFHDVIEYLLQNELVLLSDLLTGRLDYALRVVLMYHTNLDIARNDALQGYIGRERIARRRTLWRDDRSPTVESEADEPFTE